MLIVICYFFSYSRNAIVLYIILKCKFVYVAHCSLQQILTSDKCMWVCQIDNDVIYIHDNNIAKVVFNV